MTTTFIKADIHDEIKNFPDNHFDFIYTNPPFGTTGQKWDISLDWTNLFPSMWRVLKDDGCIAIHTAMPFTYDLIALQKPKYHYVWQKSTPTLFLHAKKQPLRDTEEILIFYKKSHKYNPQMIGDEVYTKISHTNTKYYIMKNRENHKGTKHQVGQYPRTFIGKFKRVIKGGKSVPEEIIRRMILTHSNENDKILDMTHHNQYVGDIAKELNRNYIGVDIQPEFY